MCATFNAAVAARDKPYKNTPEQLTWTWRERELLAPRKQPFHPRSFFILFFRFILLPRSHGSQTEQHHSVSCPVSCKHLLCWERLSCLKNLNPDWKTRDYWIESNIEIWGTTATKFPLLDKMSVLLHFEEYQKARVKFVQAIAEAATRPQNIEVMHVAGVMQLLRPLLLDNVSDL